MSMPAVERNSAAAKYCVLPTEIEAMLYLPGSAFASLIRSCTLLTREAGSATIAKPKKPTRRDHGKVVQRNVRHIDANGPYRGVRSTHELEHRRQDLHKGRIEQQ